MSESPGTEALYVHPEVEVAMLVGAGAPGLPPVVEPAEPGELVAVFADVAGPEAVPEDPVALPPAGAKSAGFCESEHPASSRQPPRAAARRPLYLLPCFMSTIPAFPLVIRLWRLGRPL